MDNTINNSMNDDRKLSNEFSFSGDESSDDSDSDLKVDTEIDEPSPISTPNRTLHTSRQDKAITDLFRMINESNIMLTPDFQRKYVWTNKGASKFIESLLLNIPIPTIFVSTNNDDIWDVVDGQQRLTAIKLFCSNNLKLSGLETLAELNTKLYKDLDEKTQRTLNNRTLSVVIIDNDSSEEIKFDIFMRINQGSVKLNEQELRNCLYRGNLITKIKELGTNQRLNEILNGFDTFINRYQHLEIIERFFTIREIIDVENDYNLKQEKYGGRIKNSINNFIKEHRNDSDEKLSDLSDCFNQSIEKVYAVFGKDSFKQYINGNYTYKVNRAIAEMQLVILSFFECEFINKNKIEIKRKFEETMLENTKFSDSFIRATNNTTVVNYRYETFGKILKTL